MNRSLQLLAMLSAQRAISQGSAENTINLHLYRFIYAYLRAHNTFHHLQWTIKNFVNSYKVIMEAKLKKTNEVLGLGCHYLVAWHWVLNFSLLPPAFKQCFPFYIEIYLYSTDNWRTILSWWFSSGFWQCLVHVKMINRYLLNKQVDKYRLQM